MCPQIPRLGLDENEIDLFRRWIGFSAKRSLGGFQRLGLGFYGL